MQLSNNFSLKEMTASQTADRHGISNNPSEDHMDNLKKLCENILQPNDGNWSTAAVEMMDSRWAKQVGVRAERLRDRIKALST